MSQEELIAGYEKIYGIKRATKIVKRIFAKIDQDKLDQIDYWQFVVATINKERLLSEKRLKQIFILFDKDQGGTISADEVKEMLCQTQNIDDNVWKEII